MAKNIVDIPRISPLKWRKRGYVNPSQYNTKYFDDHNFEDTISNYMYPAKFLQPWQKDDIIFHHHLSNYSPHQLYLYDCDGHIVDTFSVVHATSSIEISGLRVFRASISLQDYDEGDYQFVLTSGSPVIDTLETEWFRLAEHHENTMLLQYTHNQNDFGVAFELLDEFRLRVPGGIRDFQPESISKVFIDQGEQIEQLSSSTFYTEKFVLGNGLGVPPWFIRKVNDIQKCSTVLYDGKQYVKPEGSKWEPYREPDYLMAGWAVDIRPADNSDSKRFIAEGAQDEESSSIVFNIETTGFGTFTDPASSNLIQILRSN